MLSFQMVNYSDSLILWPLLDLLLRHCTADGLAAVFWCYVFYTDNMLT